jgi:hypothetical protein
MLGGTLNDVKDGEDEKRGFPQIKTMMYLGSDDDFKVEKLEMFELPIKKCSSLGE